MALKFTDAIFSALLQSDEFVVVDFWAEWCGPCVTIGPIIDSIAIDPEFVGKVTIGKMNVDHNPITPTKYNVRSIPTILFFKNGELVDKQLGLVSREMIVAKINSVLAH